MKARTIKYLGIAVAIATGGLVSWRLSAGRAVASESKDAGENTPVVAAAETVRSDLATTIRLTAEFRPYQQIDIHAKVAGFVSAIPVDIGDRVKAGDVIATLEIPELQEDLKQAAAAVDAARDDVRLSQANYQAAHDVFTRLQQVAREHPKLVAQQDLDDLRAKDQAAAAGLAGAQRHVEETEAAQSREMALVAYSRLTAPFEGVVTRRYADVGALIQAGTSSTTQGTAVVSLAQENVLRVMFPVPESAVSSVRLGEPVQIAVSGLHRYVTGAVTRFSRELNDQTRTMETEVDIPNDDLSITPGMYGWAELTLEEHRDTLNLPLQAVAIGAHPDVYLINKDDQLEERPVTLGMETAGRVEITHGLRLNDLVFIGNRNQFHTGMRVQAKLLAPNPGPEPGADS
jgi:RND family efflux transporter MFP subunit